MDNFEVQRAVQDRLERLLELHSLSKAELARRSGLPSRTVENYFKGHAPSLEALVAIAKGNHVTIDWLLGHLSPKQSEEVQKELYLCVNSAANELLKLTEVSSQPSIKIDWNGEQREVTISELSEYIANNAVQKYGFVQAADLVTKPAS